MQQLLEDIKNSLATDRSDPTRKKWAKYIVENKIPMMSLMELLDAAHPIGMRFTWVFGEIIKLDPNHLFPVAAHCFALRDKITFPGFKRTIAKMLALAGVPEEIEGLVVDQLFKWVLNPKIKVAVKVFSIDTLSQLCFKYPDLKEELLLVIEDQLDKNSAALRARAKMVLKRLEKCQ
jgi:hypothetical protein